MALSSTPEDRSITKFTWDSSIPVKRKRIKKRASGLSKKYLLSQDKLFRLNQKIDDIKTGKKNASTNSHKSKKGAKRQPAVVESPVSSPINGLNSSA